MTTSPAEPCGGFGGVGCSEYGPSVYGYARRRELRFHAPIGTSFLYDSFRFTVGVAPYLVLSADTLRTDCEGCAATALGSFDEDWGATLVFRFDARDPRRRSER